MMDGDELNSEETCEESKDGSGSCSPAGSLSSSLSSSQDFRRLMVKPPNRKKYEESMEELAKLIRAKEAEQKSLITQFQEKGQELRGVKSEREAAIGKKKKIDGELRLLNQEITKKMGSLSRVESNLHYKNEAKIDDAIRNMEWQLKTQNFRLAEERKIVAEVDKLKRSKKVLVEYFSQKREVDKIRENQRRMRGERDYYNKAVNNLGKREEEARRISRESKAKAEELKTDLNELYEKKRQMFSDFKQNEADFQKAMAQKRSKLRKESFKKREEDRKAKEEAMWKERLKYEALKEPFEDEKNLCNTLISYLHRYITTEREDMTLPSPRDEQPEHPIGSTPGPADSLDDGMFVLLKKSEEDDYCVSSKRPSRRSRKGRKLSVTKPLAHTPQIIAQFSSLNLNAPSTMSEVPTSIEQLHARKRYYDEHSGGMSHPLLGSLSGSFSSSGSMSSLDSPLHERNSTWGFVEVPPAIAEHQTQSDAGTSADTGFHDMSRQASKTESSESATDCPVSDQILAEIIAGQKPESDYSRSSSDTITPDEHLLEEHEACVNYTSQLQDEIQACQGNEGPASNPLSNASVFDSVGNSVRAAVEKLSTFDNGQVSVKSEMGAKIANYDDDFPPALSKVSADSTDVIQTGGDRKCDSNASVRDSMWNRNQSLCDTDIRLSKQGNNIWNINQNSYDNLILDSCGGHGHVSERVCPEIVVSEEPDSYTERLPFNARENEDFSQFSTRHSIEECETASSQIASSVICNADEMTHL